MSPPEMGGSSLKSTSFWTLIGTALASVLTTQLPHLDAATRVTMIIVVGVLGLGWIICSAAVKRSRAKQAAGPSAGAGLVAIAPALPAIAAAVASLARTNLPGGRLGAHLGAPPPPEANP